MSLPISALATGISIILQSIQEAKAAQARGDALSAEQSRLIALAADESFWRLAEVCGHGGEAQSDGGKTH